MNRLMILVISFWVALPCFAASDAVLRKQDTWFLDIQKHHPKVIGASFNNGAVTKLDFAPDASKAERDAANAAKANFAAFTPPPKADYRAFKANVFNDEQIPLSVRINLTLYYPLLDYVDRGEASAEQLQTAWQEIAKQLGPELSAAVQQHAAATNVPLVQE